MANSAKKAPSRRPLVVAALSTIFGSLVISAMVAMLTYPVFTDTAPIPQGLRFLGRLHPVVLHLPIGMLTLVILMELGGRFRKSSASTLVPMFFAAASAVVAVAFGYFLWQSAPEEFSGELLQDHLKGGVVFGCLAVLTFVVKSWVDAAGGRGGFFYLLLLLASGGVMAVASHDGGSITHGKSYLTDEAPEPVKSWLTGRSPVATALPVEPPKAATAAETGGKVSYVRDVQPIFDSKCVSCHGPDKTKGKLRMDSYEWLLKGGKEGDAFEAGDTDSNILFRVHLPLDDEEHMPPEGKKQMTDSEIELVTRWIQEGAEGE